MFSGFVDGGASYLSLVDVERSGAVYDRYELSGVILRENFAEDKDGVKKGEAVLYYISKKSSCRNAFGEKCPIPRPKTGDLVTLHARTADEITYRVAEAGYFVGTGKIEYVRIKLA